MAGPLRSTGVTPLRATTDPSAVLPPSAHFPRSVIGPTSLHGISPVDGKDFSSCSVTLCSRAAAFTPPRSPQPFSWLESKRCCLRPLTTGSALRFVNNEATFAFTHRCGPEARSPHLVGLCRWAPRSRSPLTPPSKLRGHQLLPRRDSHPIVITRLNLDTQSGLTPLYSCPAMNGSPRPAPLHG
jgi:hypothetical protein